VKVAVRAPEDFGDAGLRGAGVSFGFDFGVSFDFGVGFAVAGGGDVDGVGVLVVSTFVAVGVLVAENPAFDTGSAPGLKSARPTKKLPITTMPKHTPKKAVFQKDALRAPVGWDPSVICVSGPDVKTFQSQIYSAHQAPSWGQTLSTSAGCDLVMVSPEVIAPPVKCDSQGTGLTTEPTFCSAVPSRRCS
jgi:hypothetical protein